MTTQKKASIVLAVIAALLIGNWVKEEFFPSKPDRPVLAFLARVAKFGMWFLMFAEPQQPSPGQSFSAVDADHIDHMRSL